jgi:hypothetical protein
VLAHRSNVFLLKRRLLLVLICSLSLTGASATVAQEVSVSIDQIREADVITGRVKGLDPAEFQNYRVLVYVHTDQWYIHPYAGQGRGMSWAGLANDGTWRIRTVKREFKADKVAVLVVRKPYASEPSKIDSLEDIPYVAQQVKTLTGTSDYGKL